GALEAGLQGPPRRSRRTDRVRAGRNAARPPRAGLGDQAPEAGDLRADHGPRARASEGRLMKPLKLQLPVGNEHWAMRGAATGRLKDGILHGEGNKTHKYGAPYCTTDDKDAYVEKQWRGPTEKYWATWTEAQYVAVGKLLKAICHKHHIPKMILPEEHRFEGFDLQKDVPRFRGICHHVNINPGNRDDLGPYVDWDKIIRYATLSVGDCFNNPAEGVAPAKKPAKKPQTPAAKEP